MTSIQEVSQHASQSSCWITINGEAYDVTNFLDNHPGGKQVILKLAGSDATESFEQVHSKDLLLKYKDHIPKIGRVEDAVDSETAPQQEEGLSRAQRKRLVRVINIDDFEAAAQTILSPKHFAFFKAGADSEIATRWNARSWDAIRFRPRILKPVSQIDISANIFGSNFSAPFFIAPAGGGKFAHRQGEVLLTRAAAKYDILHWVCNNAGCSQAELADARAPGQALFWQIYAMRDLEITKKEIKQAEVLGYKGVCLTVDAVQVGKRERDMRFNIEENDPDPDENESTLANSISATRPAVYDGFDFASAVAWLKSITNLPIAIKGIQTWEDALLCMQHGVHPWLSNHGGRQLDGAPSSAETLLEMREHCPEVLEKCDVIVDGGITRGGDIIKALSLGARGVAMGRGFLFALAFGEEGVGKAIRILKHEMEMTMGLLGVSSIDQLRPSHVDARGLTFAGAATRARL